MPEVAPLGKRPDIEGHHIGSAKGHAAEEAQAIMRSVFVSRTSLKPQKPKRLKLQQAIETTPSEKTKEASETAIPEGTQAFVASIILKGTKGLIRALKEHQWSGSEKASSSMTEKTKELGRKLFGR